METVENVIIVGGGPAGLAAALYNARAGLKPFVIAGSPPGGQLTLTSEVENYPGYESILGPELIQKYRKHAERFGTRFADENVTSVDFGKRPFRLQTGSVESGKTYQAKSVIIATGAKALWLGLDNETRLRGRGVSACATCDGFFFKNKIVAVVGGGDTAMEEALTLTNFASKVYVIHRRSEFRASKIMQDRVLKHDKIEIIWNTEVVDVLGENKVEGIKLKEENNERTLPVDALFLAIGHKPDTDFLKGSGVELDQKGYVITGQRAAIELAKSKFQIKSQIPNPKSQVQNEHSNIENFRIENFQYMTSLEGVFAAGDNVDYQYRQAGTAVGMGIAAALDAERFLSEEGD